MSKGIVDLAAVYMFIKRLVTPFDQWDAYKTGVIDENGKILVRKNERTQEQSQSWGYFDRLVGNLKKLLAKVPGGKTRLGSFAAALLLIREQNIDPDDLQNLQEKLEYYLEEAKFLTEDALPTNNAGGGNIAGIGVGPEGEPGVTPKAWKKHKKKAKEKAKQVSRRVSAMMEEDNPNEKQAKERIKSEKQRDKVKFDRLLDRSRIQDARLKNRKTRP